MNRLQPTSLTTNTGQVAFVTGAASGLGAATTAAFIDAGFHVACSDIQEPNTNSNSSPNDNVYWYALNVVDEEESARTIEKVIDRYGRIDVLVNCAGVDHTFGIDELTVAQFDQIVAVNLRAPFVLAKAVWPYMQQQQRGHIVNVVSTAALRGWSGASAYHASKAGLVGLSKGLGVEGRRWGINVTAVIPGGMRTSFFDRFQEQGIPMPDDATLQDPAHVAELICFVVSRPPGSVIQEVLVTSPHESSWP